MQRVALSLGNLLSERGEPLDHDVKQRMEAGFSMDFSRVRVHRSPLSALANRVLRSRAFTVRDQIFFSANAYQPRRSSGRLLIAHELAHVIQKRLDPTTGSGKRPFTGPLAAENEAHVAAEEITRGSRFTCSVPVDPEATSCWSEAGHFYTSHFVLLAAGLDYSLAKNIAFFAQMGDEVLELDAVEQAESYFADSLVLSNPPPKMQVDTMRKMQQSLEIERGLHCLTGGNAEVETAWRAHILEDTSETSDDLAVGLAVHAFGDSFAHRKLDDEKKCILRL